jgi:hypothetical protein
MIKVNFFVQALQVYSYVGISSPSFVQRSISSHHVGAYERNYILAAQENGSGRTCIHPCFLDRFQGEGQYSYASFARMCAVRAF